MDIPPFATLVTSQIWIVPAVVFGGPGLLVILFMALQLAGALAWLPAVRRLRGEEHPAD
ncbi:MAG TPA: hypothetical protein VHK28_04410 [Candidatus Limnocylindria bacterium]|nr:hypothetical protein [Candidatus Limnocylindria bacterium]